MHTRTHARTRTRVPCVGGTLDASEELREFARATGIPITSTLMGLGSYPTDDPQSLQMLGMHGTVFANYAIDQVRARGGAGLGQESGNKLAAAQPPNPPD